MYAKFQCHSMHRKKIIQNISTLLSLTFFLLLPSFTKSQGLNYFFSTMTLFIQNPAYVNNIWLKFLQKRLRRKNNILTIYKHLFFSETLVKTVLVLQLWHPHMGWKIGYLLWSFYNFVILMLLTCVTGLKAKLFLKKLKHSKSTNMCNFHKPFHYFQTLHIPKCCLLLIPHLFIL